MGGGGGERRIDVLLQLPGDRDGVDQQEFPTRILVGGTKVTVTLKDGKHKTGVVKNCLQGWLVLEHDPIVLQLEDVAGVQVERD